MDKDIWWYGGGLIAMFDDERWYGGSLIAMFDDEREHQIKSMRIRYWRPAIEIVGISLDMPT